MIAENKEAAAGYILYTKVACRLYLAAGRPGVDVSFALYYPNCASWLSSLFVDNDYSTFNLVIDIRLCGMGAYIIYKEVSKSAEK